MHSNEQDVAQCLALKAKSTARKQAFQKILYKGNFLHNVAILNGEKDGELIVVRRSNDYCDPSSFLPCTVCYGFFRKGELWRHFRTCPHRKEKSSAGKGLLAEAQVLLDGALYPNTSGNSDRQALNPILAKMHSDDIFAKIKDDPLILRFGSILLSKLGQRRKNNIAQRMRQLGRLKKEMQINHLEEGLKGGNFDQILDGVRRLCNAQVSKDGISVFEKPALALRIGHNLKKAAHIKYGLALRQDDKIGQNEAEVFLTLYQQEWTDKISSVALASLAVNRFQKPQLLPCTEDLTKLTIYVDEEITRLTPLCQNTSDFKTWRSLCETTMVKVILFNKRRGGEVEDIRLDAYLNRQKKPD